MLIVFCQFAGTVPDSSRSFQIRFPGFIRIIVPIFRIAKVNQFQAPAFFSQHHTFFIRAGGFYRLIHNVPATTVINAPAGISWKCGFWLTSHRIRILPFAQKNPVPSFCRNFCSVETNGFLTLFRGRIPYLSAIV